ncbi:glycoside hydrolase family 32 protein [Cellulomonas sp. Root137]|uniref:glycoside hydrolase family 32 protein n=1 Tax=Cellulomonas sp. Root137 TaxID=1736459 RepID=UPI0006F2CE24|nr:glycoside hydrolase family 32 protein [Cellulomonas sp. Root137]KQY43848.1 levanase [Cellulomonas sp. Root137]
MTPAPAAGVTWRARGRRVVAAVVAVGLGLCACTPADDERPSPAPSPPYTERWRPQLHYTPPEGRLADPNGLVHDGRQWHLFHQQDGTWAHAVSPDAVHWTTLPTALEHDELGQALSGSVVVDGADTSGLFDGPPGGLVAVYTSTVGGEAQSLAYSSDGGLTWRRYVDNPVIANEGRTDFRDPKVFWHEPTRRWVMVVSTGDQIGLFGSTDLLRWVELSSFGRGQGLHSAVWECPDLFPLQVDGDPERVRWVLTVSVGASDATGGSTAQYFVGDFDGTTFTRDPSVPDDTVQLTDVGQDFYAAQSYEQAPDGRRVWIGWMGNWRYPYEAPTRPWTNAMSVPRDLDLRTVGGQVRLVQSPAPELASLRGQPVRIGSRAIERDTPLPLGGPPYELEAEIETGDAGRVGLRVLESRGADGIVEESVEVGYTAADGGQVYLERTGGVLAGFAVRRSAAYRPTDGTVRLHLLVDASSVEVFVDDGALTGTMLAFPAGDGQGLSLVSEGGRPRLRSLTYWPLDSIWR